MRILLTGASRGIGRAIAKTLAGEGHSLALCASGPSDALEETISLCHGSFGLSGDLGQPDTAPRLVDEAVSRLGGLDAVISNAGIAISGNLTDMSTPDWERVFDVNTRAPWRLAVAAYPHMKASDAGNFLAVASMSGVEPYPGTGAYSASKAALIMMVRTLALEWAASGVRANCASPGLFLSSMTAPIYADPSLKAAREALVPMKRIGDPARDFAGLVQFLISPEAGYITGQNILADGGLMGSIHSQIAGRPQSGNV